MSDSNPTPFQSPTNEEILLRIMKRIRLVAHEKLHRFTRRSSLIVSSETVGEDTLLWNINQATIISTIAVSDSSCIGEDKIFAQVIQLISVCASGSFLSLSDKDDFVNSFNTCDKVAEVFNLFMYSDDFFEQECFSQLASIIERLNIRNLSIRDCKISQRNVMNGRDFFSNLSDHKSNKFCGKCGSGSNTTFCQMCGNRI